MMAVAAFAEFVVAKFNQLALGEGFEGVFYCGSARAEIDFDTGVMHGAERFLAHAAGQEDFHALGSQFAHWLNATAVFVALIGNDLHIGNDSILNFGDRICGAVAKMGAGGGVQAAGRIRRHSRQNCFTHYKLLLFGRLAAPFLAGRNMSQRPMKRTGRQRICPIVSQPKAR